MNGAAIAVALRILADAFEAPPVPELGPALPPHPRKPRRRLAPSGPPPSELDMARADAVLRQCNFVLSREPA